MTCAVTGVLISPISWDNHWVWIVPVLVLLADAGFRARGAARWGYWGFGAALAGVFADWPTHWTGRLAFVPHGLVGFDVRRHPMSEIFHLQRRSADQLEPVRARRPGDVLLPWWAGPGWPGATAARAVVT